MTPVVSTERSADGVDCERVLVITIQRLSGLRGQRQRESTDNQQIEITRSIQ